MKRTELAKFEGKKISGKANKSSPARFGAASAPVMDRRAQRKLDQERGLIPFAIKLNSELVKQIHDIAQERQVEPGDVVDELLRKALAQ